MRKFYLLPVLLICTFSLCAQSWQWGARGGGGNNGNTNDAETVLDMATDNAGNVYVVSRFESGGGATITGLPNSVGGYGLKDVLISSYSCNGVFRWKKVLGGAGNDGYKPMAIGTDTLGNVYITGMGGQLPPPLPPYHFDTDSVQPSTNQRQFIVVQYDTSGNLKWIRWPTPDTVPVSRQTLYSPRDMIVNPNGEVEILCHMEKGQLSGSNIVVDTPSAYILKYDINGNITGLIKPDLNWRQVDGNGMAPTGLGNIRMAKTRGGKYVVSGRQNINPLSPGDPLVIGGQKIMGPNFVALFNSQWQTEWKRNNDTILMSFGYRPVVDEADNIYLAATSLHGEEFFGFTVTNVLTTIGHSLPVLLKLNSAGTVVYGTNGSTNSATGAAAVSISGSRIFVTGHFPGKLVWDNFTLENPPNTGYDLFLAGFDLTTGTILRLDSLKGSSGARDNAAAMISDNRGNIYLGGELGSSLQVGSSTLQSAGGNSDFFIAKYGTADCSGTIVPVRLTTFTATLQNNDVLTRWQTAQEQNTKAFIVERSTNAVAFTPLGTVPAKGNSNVVQTYSFTDTDLFPSANSQLTTHNSLFYRLKILDLDGSYTYSSIAKINLTAIKGISIYPNPARSTAVISYATALAPGSPEPGTLNLELYSMLGNKISSITLPAHTGTQTLNTATLPAGIYNVVLRSNGKVVGSEKLVIEK